MEEEEHIVDRNVRLSKAANTLGDFNFLTSPEERLSNQIENNTPTSTTPHTPTAPQDVWMNDAARAAVRKSRVDAKGINYLDAIGITSNSLYLKATRGHLFKDNPPDPSFKLTSEMVQETAKQQGIRIDLGGLTASISNGDIRSKEDWDEWVERHKAYIEAEEEVSTSNPFLNFATAIPFVVADPINAPDIALTIATGGQSILARAVIGGLGGAVSSRASATLIQEAGGTRDEEHLDAATYWGLGLGAVFNVALGKRGGKSGKEREPTIMDGGDDGSIRFGDLSPDTTAVVSATGEVTEIIYNPVTKQMDVVPSKSLSFAHTLLQNIKRSDNNVVRWAGHLIDSSPSDVISPAMANSKRGLNLQEVKRGLSSASSELGKEINLAQEVLGYGKWGFGDKYKKFLVDLEEQYVRFVNGRPLTKENFLPILQKRAEYDKKKTKALEDAGIDTLDDYITRGWDFEGIRGAVPSILLHDFTRAILSKRLVEGLDKRRNISTDGATIAQIKEALEALEVGADMTLLGIKKSVIDAARREATQQIEMLSAIKIRGAGVSPTKGRKTVDLDESYIDKYLLKNIHSRLAADRHSLAGKIATGQVMNFINHEGMTKWLNTIKSRSEKEITIKKALDPAFDESKSLRELSEELAKIKTAVEHIWETAMTPNRPNGIANMIKEFMNKTTVAILGSGFGTVAATSEISSVFSRGSLSAVMRSLGSTLPELRAQIQRLPASEEYYRYITTMVDAHTGYSHSLATRFIAEGGEVDVSRRGFFLQAADTLSSAALRLGGLDIATDSYRIASAMANIDTILTKDLSNMSASFRKQLETAKLSVADVVELQRYTERITVRDERGNFVRYALWELPDELLAKFSNYVANTAEHDIIAGNRLHMPTPFSNNDPLVNIFTQFLGFPAQAHESLLIKGMSQGDARAAVGVLIGVSTISTMLLVKEELEVKLGIRKEWRRRYTSDAEGWGNLSIDVFSKIGVTGSLSFVSGLGTNTWGRYADSSVLSAYGGYNAERFESIFGAFQSGTEDSLTNAMKINMGIGRTTMLGKIAIHALEE